MDIRNPLSGAEVISQKNKAANQDSKIAYSINRSKYLTKTNTFCSFEEESIGSS